MALSLKARKRLAVLILVIGMPLFVVLAVTIIDAVNARWGRMPVLLELAVFVALGVVWALPFRRLFRSLGRGE